MERDTPACRALRGIVVVALLTAPAAVLGTNRLATHVSADAQRLSRLNRSLPGLRQARHDVLTPELRQLATQGLPHPDVQRSPPSSRDRSRPPESRAAIPARSLAAFRFTGAWDPYGSVAHQDWRPLRAPLVQGVRLQRNLVQVEVIARSAALTRPALSALGMKRAGVLGEHLVTGWLPVGLLDAASKLPGIVMIRPGIVVTHAGSVQSQGVVAQYTTTAIRNYRVNGFGVRVGIMSDSFDCVKQGDGADSVAAGIASHDLPTGLHILKEGDCSSGADEGRAMAEIVHDVAPGASIYFYTGFGGRADFAAGMQALKQAKVNILVEDVAYPAEPFFQDGLLAQAANAVVANGVAYFSAAGNGGAESYSSTFADSGIDYPTSGDGGKYHAFGSSDACSNDFDDPANHNCIFQEVEIPLGAKTTLSLQWDEPFFTVSGGAGARTDLDLVLTSASGTVIAAGLSNNIGSDPLEVVSFENDGSIDANHDGKPDTRFFLSVALESGPAPGRFKYSTDNGLTILNYWGGTGSPVISQAEAELTSTVSGQAGAANVFAVGAANYNRTPAYRRLFGSQRPEVAGYSAQGGTPILFDASGNRLGAPQVRNKPDAVAVDGVTTTFFGVFDAATGDPRNFYGTSAAAPHAAGIAALLFQRDHALTPAGLYARMKAGAIDMGPPGFDYATGSGMLQANTIVGGGSPPIADAGPGLSGSPAQSLTLDGTGSIDPDDDIVSYQWAQVPGELPAVTLSQAGQVQASVTVPDVDTDTRLNLRLTVTDSGGRTSTAATTLLARAASGGPIADAGADAIVSQGATLTLGGSNTRGRDAAIQSYQWTQLSGPKATIVNPGAAQTSIVTHVVKKTSKLMFQLTVTDANGSTDSDAVKVTETSPGRLPLLGTGPASTAIQGQITNLLASAIDPQDSALSFLWSCICDGLRVKTRSPTGRQNEAVAPPVTETRPIDCHLTVTNSQGDLADIRTTIADHPDASPPQVKSAGSTTVDVTSAPATATFDIEVTDDASGVDYIGANVVENGFPYAQLPGTYFFPCVPAAPNSPLDCVIHVSFEFPRYAPAGSWFVYFAAFDKAGNQTVYYNPAATNVQVVDLSPDTADPQIQSVSPSTQSVDVTSGPVAVTLNVQASDDLSGIGDLHMYLHSPADHGFGHSLTVPFASVDGCRHAGLSCTDTYSFTFPQNAVPGDWIALAQIADEAGNLQELNNLATVTVVNPAGAPPPPRITGITVVNPIVNITDAPAQVMIDVQVESPVSGLADTSSIRRFSVFQNSAYLQSWTGAIYDDQAPTITCTDPGRNHCTIRFYFNIPALTLPGAWPLSFVQLVDETGISMSRNLHNDPLPSQYVVYVIDDHSTTANDTRPPRLDSVQVVANPPADVTGADAPIVVNMKASDDISGISYVQAILNSPDGTVHHRATFAFALDATDCPNGGLSCTARIPMRVPRYSQPGSWTVSVLMVDNSGNSVQVDNQTRFRVTNTGSRDTSAPTAAPSVATTCVDVGNGVGVAEIDAQVTDDLSGLDGSGNFDSAPFATLLPPSPLPGGGTVLQSLQPTEYDNCGASPNNCGVAFFFDLPRHSPTGSWLLNELGLFDRAGNALDAGPAGSTPFGATYTIDVVDSSSGPGC